MSRQSLENFILMRKRYRQVLRRLPGLKVRDNKIHIIHGKERKKETISTSLIDITDSRLSGYLHVQKTHVEL